MFAMGRESLHLPTLERFAPEVHEPVSENPMMSAAAESMQEQAAELKGLVSIFNILSQATSHTLYRELHER